MSSVHARSLRRSDVVVLFALAAMVAVGALAYRALPARLVVHWSLGYEEAYYGLRTLPKAVGLAVVPAVTVVVVAAMRAPLGLVDEELGPVRRYYGAMLALVATLMAAVQFALVGLNL